MLEPFFMSMPVSWSMGRAVTPSAAALLTSYFLNLCNIFMTRSHSPASILFNIIQNNSMYSAYWYIVNNDFIHYESERAVMLYKLSAHPEDGPNQCATARAVHLKSIQLMED
jgi:hypothetical protein